MDEHPHDPLAYDVAVAAAEHLTALLPLVPPEETRRKMILILCASLEAYRLLREREAHEPSRN